MKQKVFPVLYHKGKSGALVEWHIWVVGNTIFTRHGQVGGKMQETPGVVCEAKNVGRSNETTPEEQAILEAKAMWTFKVERKYSETKEDAQEEVFLPMLAADFKKRKGKGVHYPVDIQPKLDGVRAMAYWEDGRIVLGTRSGKEWTAPKHIMRELETYMPLEMVLDGELYIHGIDFESLSSWTKKLHPETAQMEYHVFDMPLDENGARGDWVVRHENMSRFFTKNSKKMKMVKRVGNIGGKNEKDVLAAEESFVEEGYEGAMVRNLNGEYLFGHRSNDLLKVKSSQDAEYKIVGFTHGKGSHSKAVKWICKTSDGIEFEVNPKAPLKVKEQLFHDGKKHIGKWLKVKYQNLTVDGKPRFARSVGFRDERDM
jgi:DNA ligase 1